MEKKFEEWSDRLRLFKTGNNEIVSFQYNDETTSQVYEFCYVLGSKYKTIFDIAVNGMYFKPNTSKAKLLAKRIETFIGKIVNKETISKLKKLVKLFIKETKLHPYRKQLKRIINDIREKKKNKEYVGQDVISILHKDNKGKFVVFTHLDYECVDFAYTKALRNMGCNTYLCLYIYTYDDKEFYTLYNENDVMIVQGRADVLFEL